MSDLLLGVIIGGIIGLVGSLIQGYYLLKGKREDNLARERQQSMQIQYEKDSQVLSNRIAIRSSYLDPLTSDLSRLYSSIDVYERELMQVINSYERKGQEIQVHEEEKQEFNRQLDDAENTYKTITGPIERMGVSVTKVSDTKLMANLSNLMQKTLALTEARDAMKSRFKDSKEGHDFVYDFKEIMELIPDLKFSIKSVHVAIESLLAGADVEDE